MEPLHEESKACYPAIIATREGGEDHEQSGLRAEPALKQVLRRTRRLAVEIGQDLRAGLGDCLH